MNQAENKSKKKKISPVDIVIAAIFLIALLSMIYLVITLLAEDRSLGQESGVEADCRLKIENVEIERFGITLNEMTGGVECAFLKTGDLVYDPQTGKEIGKITAVAYEIATASSGEVDEEGNLIYVEYPGYVDLILTVRMELQGEQDWSAGSLSIRIGQQIAFRTASYEATAVIASVKTGVN